MLRSANYARVHLCPFPPTCYDSVQFALRHPAKNGLAGITWGLLQIPGALPVMYGTAIGLRLIAHAGLPHASSPQIGVPS